MTASTTPDNPDLSLIRDRLRNSTGRGLWRSLDELAQTDEFQRYLEQEFPVAAELAPDGFSRRRFLQLMGASLALAGVTGCGEWPEEKIVPFVRQREYNVPGQALYFATALTLSGYARGALVESHGGRPIKVEGNPEHPASLGATDAIMQAEVLSLYDPDRATTVRHLGLPATWSAFAEALAERSGAWQDNGGAGLAILTPTITSPTAASLMRQLIERYPQARWSRFEPINQDAQRQATQALFGRPLDVLYRFDQAAVVVTLDDDFMATGPASVRYARDYMRRRRQAVGEADLEMTRLYALETTPSPTGVKADHRFPVEPRELRLIAEGLARRLGVSLEGQLSPDWQQPDWLEAMADDLRDHAGRCIVTAGLQAPAEVHALALAINDRLGNLGQTVKLVEPIEAEPTEHGQSLTELTEAMAAGEVSDLLILGGNPAYTAPADVPFVEAMENVPFRAHLTLHRDETSRRCHWELPSLHELEAWGDARAFDGTTTIQQPLIKPLYDGRSTTQLIAMAMGRTAPRDYQLVRDYWQQRFTENFERQWRIALHEGVVPDTQAADASAQLSGPVNLPAALPRLNGNGEYLMLTFRPDPCLWDGRYANNAWLQELPQPLTKISWDNALFVSIADAERMGLSNNDLVTLRTDTLETRAPVWVLPGQPAGVATLHLGYGQSHGRVGKGVGFNAYAMRLSDQPWHVPVRVEKLGRQYPLATTQNHFLMENRDLVRHATVEHFYEEPGFAHHGHAPELREQTGGEEGDRVVSLSLYPDDEPGLSASVAPIPDEERGPADNEWGMAIDLTSCMGCNACVTACQSENNIPVVGKKEVMRGREMHWLRIDHYWEGGPDYPQSHFQPVPCMHCENAPCEPVCPVEATTHSDEGVNEMTYNRCVGTRYCSNNCPYKVRRFNYFEYADWDTPVLSLMRNPDVTVRTRGVMEKCTYCIQRINLARIEAKKEDRPIVDGQVQTACAGACPTEAITFGNMADPSSNIRALKDSPLNYGLLEHLGTRPRTTYLAKLTNPNPRISLPDHQAKEHG